MDVDLSKVAPEDLPRVKALLAELVEYNKYNKYLTDFFDSAYAWQKRVAELTGSKTVIGTISANRVGKSEIGCAILTCHLTGIYPSWWEGKRYTKPVKAIAACLNSDLNKTVLQNKLFGTSNWRLKSEIGTGMIPKEYINTKSCVTGGRGDDISRISIKHKNGGYSELYFRAYSQGREAAQGVEADVILVDEQPKDDFWEECLTRLATTEGHVICSFTPLEGMTGLVEELWGLPDAENSPVDKFGSKYREDKSWAMIRASWDDITHINEDTKATLAKGYAAHSRDARIYGIPIAGHGRVYPHPISSITFDWREDRVPDHLPHLIGIDVGHGEGRDPSAAVMVAWDEDNDIVYLVDCATGPTNTTRDLARLITKLDHTVPVIWPNDANRQSMNSPSTIVDQLREMKINLTGNPFLNPKGADGKTNNFKAPGINHINERFYDGKLWISNHDNNAPLLHELEQYSYLENGKLQDGRDDIMDAMRYAVMGLIQGLGEPLQGDSWDQYDTFEEEYHFNSY